MKLLRTAFLLVLLLSGVSVVQAKFDGYCGDDEKIGRGFAFGIGAFFAFDKNNLVIACNGKLAQIDAPIHILTSNNGGKSWKKRLELDGSNIEKFVFLDSKTGYAIGASRSNFNHFNHCIGLILKTTDGGLTWKDTRIEVSKCLEDVQFIDKFNGWIATDNGRFLKTSNGGNTWKTLSGGDTWTIGNETPLTDGHFSSINFDFSDSKSGLAATLEEKFIDNQPARYEANVYQTRDGGKTWISQTSKFTDLLNLQKSDEIKFKAFKFYDAEDGFIAAEIKKISRNASDNGIQTIDYDWVIFSTKTGGASWEIKFMNAGDGLYDAIFNPNGKFWVIPTNVVDNKYILSSLNYGKSWTQVSTKFTDGGVPNRVYFLSDKVGFLIVDLGNNADDLYRTLDGGKTWKLRE